MSSRQKGTVPKFGSFKPKPAEKPSSEPLAKADPGDDAREKRQRRQERPDRHRSRSRPDRDHDSKPIPKPVTKDPGDGLFFVDKRGDPLILRYGGNERSRVPTYRRFGRGVVLGSAGLLDMRPAGSREQFAIRGFREGRSAFRDKSSVLASAARTRPERILTKRLGEQPPPPAANQEFIRLGPSRKRKRDDGERRLPYERHDSDLSSCSSSSSDTDSDASDAAGDGGSYITAAKQRSIALSDRVKAHPEDTGAWLELIGLQDELFRENEEDDHARTSDEAKGLASLKLSMYEKALPRAPDADAREKALVGLMREGSKVWSPQTLARRWAEVAGDNPHSFSLWRARVDFELTNIATFSFDNARQLFVDRLDFLSSALESPNSSESVAEQAIYVFLRLTCFLHDAGFVDQATGAWQALLEATFARPSLGDGDSRATVLSSLSEFWESELPRLGEQGARGWRTFVERGGDSAEPPEATVVPTPLPPHAQGDDVSAYKAWAAVEQQRAAEARIPARIADEGNEGDPYRVVMFPDIEPFLPLFPPALLSHIRRPLLDAWLLFCGLPPAFVDTPNSVLTSALDDSFISGRSLGFLDSEPAGPAEEEDRRKEPLFKHDASHMALAPEVLFPPSSWFSYLGRWPDSHRGGDRPVDRSLVLRTLRQLVRSFGVEDVAEYCLALEWLDEPSAAKKAARSMLKQYPSNARLYNAYALLEWANGNSDVARKVLSSATGQSSSLGAAGQFLWNTWAWIELESGGRQAAILRLCASIDGHILPEGDDVPAALILKARSHFSTKRDYLLSSGDLQDALEYAVSLALLDYLRPPSGPEPASQTQGDITAAIARTHGFSEELVSRNLTQSPAHETFLQFAARLLYYHARHGSYRPAFVREQLGRFVALFPRNTLFLNLFAWAEPGVRIDDPVRALLRRTVLTGGPHDCLATRLFAVRHELRLGNPHSTRAAMDAALLGTGADRCRGAARLWASYVRFCRRHFSRATARDAFYTAVARFPGSKQLYAEAFTTLAADMASADLKAVFSTLTTKGLRVHVDLDEFLRGAGG